MQESLMSSGMVSWILPAMLLWPLLAAPFVRFVGRDRFNDGDSDTQYANGKNTEYANDTNSKSGGDSNARSGIDARVLTLFALTVEAALGVVAWIVFKSNTGGWQISADLPWIPDIGARLTVGVDGLSLPMLVMTSLLMPLALLGSWNNVRTKTPAFGALLLALTSGLVGVFVSLDLLLFYMSWELMLIPTYFIVGIWGGVDRTKAVLKYVIMTMIGSLLMLVAIAALWTKGGGTSFSFDHFSTLSLSASEQLFMFIAFFLAFAVKSGLVPFHSWMPDAQQAAPTIGAVTIGIKVGTYAILRFAIPLFPLAVTDSRVQNTIIVLSVISIIYGAFVAMAQTDFKRLISYSSISHLGFIMLGCFVLSPQSLQGATWITINHGITTSALFLLAGMLQDRRGTNIMTSFGGLARVVPWFSLMLTLSIFSTIGLPGTNGFIGEFLVLIGTYATQPMVATISTTVVILAAIYGLRALQTMLFGKLNEQSNGGLLDLSFREVAVMSAFAVAMVWLGLAPRGVLQRVESGVQHVREHTRTASLLADSVRVASSNTSSTR